MTTCIVNIDLIRTIPLIEEKSVLIRNISEEIRLIRFPRRMSPVFSPHFTNRKKSGLWKDFFSCKKSSLRLIELCDEKNLEVNGYDAYNNICLTVGETYNVWMYDSYIQVIACQNDMQWLEMSCGHLQKFQILNYMLYICTTPSKRITIIILTFLFKEVFFD